MRECEHLYLIEEYLYFRQFSFHKRKIAFHRASMRAYQAHLEKSGVKVTYIESHEPASDIREFTKLLKETGVTEIHWIKPCDDWMNRRMNKKCQEYHIRLVEYENPSFLNSEADLEVYFAGKKRFFQTDFYKQQRVARNILLTSTAQPFGGKWSFDDENRARYPKGKSAPTVSFPVPDECYLEAIAYVEKHFANNPGTLDTSYSYPHTSEKSMLWLQSFLRERFREFGAYEDALVGGESFLHHSVLTPMLNSGLISPAQLLFEAISYAKKHEVPINSLEGFVRQVIGWREFIRGVYLYKGRHERVNNFWGFKRNIPATFWKGETGIYPVDQTIKKVLETGYCHHIERLMVLGNFMLLCEFDPDEVYKWFMELFIDSYDWVMVPNVYGMSQFADGGLMSTKPYISGSNYLLKMGDYPKGNWQNIWDALFWNFMDNQRSFMMKNPRLKMLVSSFDKMPLEKRAKLKEDALQFLQNLDKQ